VRAPVDWEPLTASLPAQPLDAVQEVALAEDQVSIAAVPLWTVLGKALKLIEGGDAGTETVAVCDALPPVPVQVSV
jgi:hypothetical protein